MSTIEQIRQTAETLRAELASPGAKPPTLDEARALAEAGIRLVEENARLAAVAESARSLVAAADACDREAERHPSSRSSAPVVRSINAMARLRHALVGVESALSGRHAGAKVDASASPESDTDQFTRGLGTAPSCPGCRKPVTDVPPNEKPKPEAIVEHHDCMFPARGARWTLPAPAERKPVAGWEKSGGVSCLAAGSLRAKVALENWVIVTECDGGLALTDTAAQLAAEDALFAIADAINALRGGR